MNQLKQDILRYEQLTNSRQDDMRLVFNNMMLRGGEDKEEPEFTPEQRKKARELIDAYGTVPAALTEWKKMDKTLSLASKMKLLMEANQKKPRISEPSTESEEKCPYCQEAIKDTDDFIQCVNGHRMHESCYCKSLSTRTWHDNAIDTMGLDGGNNPFRLANVGKCPVCRQKVLVKNKCGATRFEVKIIHPMLGVINNIKFEGSIGNWIADILNANIVTSLTIEKLPGRNYEDEFAFIWYRLLQGVFDDYNIFPLAAFGNNTSLTHLEIKNFVSLPKLFLTLLDYGNAWKTLTFENNNITDDFLYTFYSQPSILRLNHNRITDMGVKHLTYLIFLKEVDISHNPIGDKGAFNLASMRNLEKLHARDCNISSKGASYLIASSLQGGVIEMDLSDNLIADMKGLDSDIQLLLVENSFPWQEVVHLEKLNLTNNKMDEETFEFFVRRLKFQCQRLIAYQIFPRNEKVRLRVFVDDYLWYDGLEFEDNPNSVTIKTIYIYGRPEAPASACTMM